ncbi:homoserine O-acetyltransferase [Dichomitus squalens LYAD-421 SS1]|uniref:Homoserine O-acetyltransferase n=1 Tax=Dichomitus squalens TaxID=114155 RepID=A0A4Q9PM43_9APHY|nr:homoserine O-acetyltransferase [Dichomitus squalens LYAD-421 SS1]EJF64608.1 homoserine O-acetyltransferase [Dichomitus squalens LYAD-421 SS1]TBU55287.1 homoserine O-acetyltransferase [Dichomitus squalens]
MSIYTQLLEQNIYHVPSFTLESGSVLKDVPVAYKTWGQLNETKDNVMIICHAFTGSADVDDWWGPLMGHGKAFDASRFFIFCGNVLGSPYGSASPVTLNPETGKPYGPEFPLTTIRDDVRIHKLVLDHLGVSSVAVVIGGSMGGMAVLEWPLCSPPGYVKRIIPIATSARHSAWCISWGEAQRQSIYSDPSYQDGYYDAQPASGLAAARMAALLTYRSRDSFERRFGRKPQKAAVTSDNGVLTPPQSPALPSADYTLAAHNDGLRSSQSRPQTPAAVSAAHSRSTKVGEGSPPRPPIFSAQSYLRYQGDKFTSRFDANCYIHITRKLDTHDIARGRLLSPDEDENTALFRVLGTEPPRALVIGIQSDGLFQPAEQHEIAEGIPEAQLVMIPSPEGHDGFLLEFELINKHILGYLRVEFPEYYKDGEDVSGSAVQDFSIKKTSLFGEAEVDITRW